MEKYWIEPNDSHYEIKTSDGIRGERLIMRVPEEKKLEALFWLERLNSESSQSNKEQLIDYANYILGLILGKIEVAKIELRYKDDCVLAHLRLTEAQVIGESYHQRLNQQMFKK